MKIAVLLGGRSGEREVSFKTGRAVSAALRSRGHEVVEVDPVEDLIGQLRNVAPECVFVALHGTYGEDGVVQGILEWMGLPYTGSGVLASALAMDKLMTKRVLVAAGIPTPEWRVLRTADAATDLEVPLAVKPVREGSSLGFSIVREAKELAPALAKALAHDETALVERFVEGVETTVPVVGEPPRALPAIEIRPKSGVYDYESKYTPGATEELIPPPSLSEEEVAQIQELALSAHAALGCYGMSRSDFIYGPEGPMMLEVNTIPGMTETSLLPNALKAAGVDFADFAEEQIRLAIARARA